jgi:hypothetical protein
MRPQPVGAILAAVNPTSKPEADMHDIKVFTASPEEADHGVAELWRGDEQFAYTVLDDGDLMLRIEPRADGGPVVVGARGLAAALDEVYRILSGNPVVA